jgi:predicted dienelactone hydrolase
MNTTSAESGLKAKSHRDRNLTMNAFTILIFTLCIAQNAFANSAVEVFEIRDVMDPSRSASPKPDRPRLFKRFREQKAESGGRPVHLKIHIPVSGGSLPLILISHGAGGNWDTHYAQAQHLATQGYAVFCIEHPGSNTERMKSTLRWFQNLKNMIYDSVEVLGRPKDVSFLIDRAAEWNLNHPRLRGRLDLTRIGVLGHSFGAYTVLALAGARPALDWIEPRVEPGKGLGPDLSDGRIQCGIALSPQAPGAPFFLKESYASIKTPILGISGTQDKQQNGEPPIARLEAFKLWPELKGRHAMVWITPAAHLDFTDSTGGDQHGRESETRADVQKVVRAAMTRFFASCLKKNSPPGPALNPESLQPYVGGKVSRVEVLVK